MWAVRGSCEPEDVKGELPGMKKTKAKKAVKPIKTKKSQAKAVKAKPAKAAKPGRPAKVIAPVAEEALAPKTLKLSTNDASKFKRLLVELRDHLIDGVNFLASDNLKRSHREASGELSGYSLHMADAGTDNFDREFALSLVSSEQEALYEIEEALKRLEQNTYGLCGNCEKSIRRERLEAVPFARLCIQCQSSVEKDRRRPMLPTAVFSETDDDGDEKEEAEE
jgi:RNA polymerase-binding transcription factor DksA